MMDDVICLTYMTGQTRKSMTYSELKDLQSKLILFAGKDDENRQNYEKFKQVRDKVFFVQ